MAKARGLLLLNLGSPSSTSRWSVHKYLNEFLTDPFVIDIPWVWRQLLVRGIIAPTRAGKSAHAYRQIWTAAGSPLVETTRQFSRKVGASLSGTYDVRWAMRYGDNKAVDVTRDWDVDDVDVIPLYPQYAESSTRSAVEDALRALKGKRTRVLQDFYAEPEFIDVEIAKITHAAHDFKPDHVLLSFHGLPEHHLSKLYPERCHQTSACCDRVAADNRLCYRAQSFATYRAIARGLPFNADQISIGFQSRLGRRPWIKPYTDLVITDLIKQGRKRVLVSCPSFVSDCLETLEEIEMRLREQFIEEGGEDLKLVPALNADDEWVTSFTRMIKRDDLRWVQAEPAR